MLKSKLISTQIDEFHINHSLTLTHISFVIRFKLVLKNFAQNFTLCKKTWSYKPGNNHAEKIKTILGCAPLGCTNRAVAPNMRSVNTPSVFVRDIPELST